MEIYARYRYYGGRLKETGFRSRGKDYTPEKQTSVRIVCLGGSTTHGGGDIEYNETFPHYLEQIINKRLGMTFVEVLNSGLPATPTEYHRDFIKERIDDQELDIIILDSLYNHFASFYPNYYNPEIDKIFIEYTSRVKTIYRWDKMNLAEIINVFLVEHSYFYSRLRSRILEMNKKIYDRYLARRREFTENVPERIAYKVDSEEDKDELLMSFVVRYHNALEDIILTAGSRDIDVVLIIPPYPFFLDKEKGVANLRHRQYYNTVFEKAKKSLIEIGKKYDLLVIDLDKEFFQRGRSRDLFLSSIHLTRKGNYLVADIIASEIIPYIDIHYSEFKNKKTD